MYNIISMDTSLEALESKCRVHDWYYNYSDDHRVWSAGYDRKREINAILSEHNYSADAVAIHNKYAPDMFKLKSEYLQD